MTLVDPLNVETAPKSHQLTPLHLGGSLLPTCDLRCENPQMRRGGDNVPQIKFHWWVEIPRGVVRGSCLRVNDVWIGFSRRGAPIRTRRRPQKLVSFRLPVPFIVIFSKTWWGEAVQLGRAVETVSTTDESSRWDGNCGLVRTRNRSKGPPEIFKQVE